MEQSFFSSLLFKDVQEGKIFPDGKTFVDCEPFLSTGEVSRLYEKAKGEKGFNLKQFVLTNFRVPVPPTTTYTSDRSKPVEKNVEQLWEVLTREPDSADGSLISLPHPYIVPGGRFGEIYYWDSYFTMLGLAVSGRINMIENMVKNFSFLIDTIGYIPNGNRTYYIGRSQPPFYSLMIRLLAEHKGNDILVKYLPQLQKEYDFWMRGAEELKESRREAQQAVMMTGGEIMNRYWDEHNTPRPEAYREDVELAHASGDPEKIYRHLRAGAASGWDFSSRWFRDPQQFESIHTTDIIPVDLNCLLYHLEEILAEGYRLSGDGAKESVFQAAAEKRRSALQQYCWDETKRSYVDYDFAADKKCPSVTLAAAFPLYFKIAEQEQAGEIARLLEEKFLKEGGLLTTLENTGQQWDAPNGWAPLQWMAIMGLENYGFHRLAADIAKRWIHLNEDVYKRTGKLMEKYNVVDTHLEAGGGEYPGQDGFGWTNGVLLALISKYGKSS